MSNDAVAHSFNTLGIVGTGAMGRGIAQLAAQAGLNVMLFDVKEGAVAEATAFINGFWQRSADKQRITQAQAEQYGERLIEARDLAALAPCDIVVEAIIEKLEAKQGLFSDLEGIVRQDAVEPDVPHFMSDESLRITAIHHQHGVFHAASLQAVGNTHLRIGVFAEACREPFKNTLSPFDHLF